MVVKNPAALKVAFGENPKTTYGNKDQYPSTRMGTAALLRSTLFQAVQYKKDKESGNLTSEDFEMEPWMPVLNGEIPLKAHAHRADDILTAIRIAKEFDIDITINAARICQVEERVGSLKKGKDADIAIFSGNPMEVFTKTLYTIINGAIIYENKSECMVEKGQEWYNKTL